MRDFAIVAIALLLFLGLGFAMGVLIVSTVARRKDPADDDDKPPRWPGI